MGAYGNTRKYGFAFTFREANTYVDVIRGIELGDTRLVIAYIGTLGVVL